MTNYMPTTEEVRDYCVYPAEFDRWLAAHEAEIRADEREKAGQRVEERASKWHHNYSHDYNKNQCFCEMYVSDVEILAAAASGDGDCQHDWQHLKGEKCQTCRRCGAARGEDEK